MRYIAGVVCVMTVTSMLHAQGSWQWQNPLPQGNSLLGIATVGRSTAYAVGDAGALVKTTDGGVSWVSTQILADNSIALYSVSFPSPVFGVTVGGEGNILISTDGGTNWFPRSSPAGKKTLRSVASAGPTTAVAVGDSGTIIHSHDAGITWRISPLGTNANLRSVYFPTPSIGYAAGDAGIILQTFDGGFTWRFVPDTTLFRNYSSVFFINNDTGWVSGSLGTILYTVDGGNNWVHQYTGVPQNLTQVRFTSSLNGFALGNGNLLHTSTAGLVWLPTALDSVNDLNAITFVDTVFGYIAGDNGEIKTTHDGGQNWARYRNNITLDLFGSFFTSPTRGWAVGEQGTAIHTTDGGTTWIRDQTPVRTSLRATYFTPANQGWAVGDADSAGTLLKSYDGTTWTRIPVDTSVSLYALSFTDAFHGWAVGQRGTVLRTTNGLTWLRTTIDTSYALSAVFFLDDLHGFVCANYGATSDKTHILKTNDGGATWIPMYDDQRTLLSIYFTSPEVGWAVGQSHRLLKTTNGGSTWGTVSNPVRGFNHFLNIRFVTSDVGWIVGTSGTIVHTVDAGKTWYIQQTVTGHTLYSCSPVDTNLVWAVGLHGAILHATDGGGPPPPPGDGGGGGGGGGKVDTDTLVHANFPSPFIPARDGRTYFPFHIGAESDVTVRIYDILGRLIIELPPVHYFTAGDYDDQTFPRAPSWDGMDLNGMNAPSGFYLFQIFTPEYIKGRRMILIR